MYDSVLGEWSRFLITLIAFLCIFGTVITVIDGYSLANNEALRLLLDKKEASQWLDDIDSSYWIGHCLSFCW